jgi:pantetheine-phosphate adenylyltransferase
VKSKTQSTLVRAAIYPGTFDPITYGHLDIIERAVEIFDRVIVSVGQNPEKHPLFSLEERMAMVRESVANIASVEVDAFSGLVVRHAQEIGAESLIRGLRAVSDFEYEFQMALVNRRLAPDIITVFLMPNERFTYLNSTIVREVASFGGDVGRFVPSGVEERLKKVFQRIRSDAGSGLAGVSD